MAKTATKAPLGEALEKLSGVDKEDAFRIMERYQAAMQNGGFESDQEREDVLADLRTYGITLEMLEPAAVAEPAVEQEAPQQLAEEDLAASEIDAEEDVVDAEVVDPDEPAASTLDGEPLEDPDGQTALATGDPVTVTNVVTGARPSRAEIKVGSFPIPVNRDYNPGEQLLVMTRVTVGEVGGFGGEVRKHAAAVTQHHLVDTHGLSPAEAIDSELDLARRAERDRAAIDHTIQCMIDVTEAEAFESYVDLAAKMRERLYDSYGIEDDAQEVTHGSEDHQEPEE